MPTRTPRSARCSRRAASTARPRPRYAARRHDRPAPAWTRRADALSRQGRHGRGAGRIPIARRPRRPSRAGSSPRSSASGSSPCSPRSPQRVTAVATDVRGHWAAPWILPVTQAGVMDVFRTTRSSRQHGAARRSRAASSAQLLTISSAQRPTDLARWRAARPRFADLPATQRVLRLRPRSPSRPAPCRPLDGNTFSPTRPATGADRHRPRVARIAADRRAPVTPDVRAHRRQSAHAAAAAPRAGLRAVHAVRHGRAGRSSRSRSPALTDALDGLIARRTGQPTTLGAWLDPMADKLLLVDDVRDADAAGARPRESPAALADGARHQPRHRDRADRRDRQSRGGAPDVPAVAARQGRDGRLHRDRRRHALRELPRREHCRVVDVRCVYASLAITLVARARCSTLRVT